MAIINQCEECIFRNKRQARLGGLGHVKAQDIVLPLGFAQSYRLNANRGVPRSEHQAELGRF